MKKKTDFQTNKKLKVLFVDIVHPILKQELNAHGFDCIDGERFTEKEFSNPCKISLN